MGKYDILLELALHRYDELNNRNILVDNKNKSMIAFVGVLLSLEVNVLPKILEMLKDISSMDLKTIIIVLIIASICCYLISIIKFISAVSYVEDFEEAPLIDDLVQSGKKNEKSREIIAKNINAFNKCIKNNHEIIEDKTIKAKEGFDFLIYGLILTTIFIVLFIIINWR